MKKRVYLRDVKNIDELDDDVEIIIDDRPLKYDEKAGKIVRPGEPGYDELPDILR